MPCARPYLAVVVTFPLAFRNLGRCSVSKIQKSLEHDLHWLVRWNPKYVSYHTLSAESRWSFVRVQAACTVQAVGKSMRCECKACTSRSLCITTCTCPSVEYRTKQGIMCYYRTDFHAKLPKLAIYITQANSGVQHRNTINPYQ